MSKHIPAQDLDQLSIQKMTFHLLKKEAEQPTFLENLKIEETQYDFFENIIRIAASKSAAFSFLEEESEAVLTMIELLEDEEENFTQHCKKLSQLFWNSQHGNSSDGILLFANINIGEDSHPMLFIAKMDYQEVLQVQTQTSEEGQEKTILQSIQNALVENESAIQKSALIDIDAHYDWDVLAQDRQKGSGKLADYFKQFLHVQEKEINAILSTQVVAEVQKWANKNSEEVLLPAEHIADYKERAVSYLRTAAEFDTHELMNVVLPEDEENPERKQDLQQSLYKHLEKNDLTTRTFAPEPEGIRTSVMKNQIKTKEGITLTWEGDLESAGIEIKNQDGQIQIIISTQDYSFK